MLRFVLSRARQAAIVAFVVTTLSFVLIHAAPGDPFMSIDASPESLPAREEMRRRFGADQSLPVQYAHMLGDFARGDFGRSFYDGRPIRETLVTVLGDTLLLMTPALVLGILAGVALGTWQGWRAGSAADRITSALTLTTLSVPEFLVGLLAAIIFAVRLGWFPATGITSPGASSAALGPWLASYARHAVLPVLTLALTICCSIARFQRTAVAAALSEEFIRTARAKGVPTRALVTRHVLRRTAGGLCTVLGLLFPALVGGAALVEVVFSWPGAGSALVNAVSGRDYPVVIALVSVGSVFVCLGSALADIAAAAVDPAARLES